MGIHCLETKYELGRLLGEGAMARVFAARDRETGLEVAVKVMREEHVGSPAMIACFTREAVLATRMMSPYAVKPLTLAVMKQRVPCIVYEHLEGETLADRLESGAPMSLDEVVQVVEQTARALGRAHALGIVHLDVKPENVFLVREPRGRFSVKLLDFGIAQRVDETGTAEVVGGTPEYIAPEVLFAGEPRASTRADLYALAVLAFECLTGRVPFVGDCVEAMRAQHLEPKRPSLSAFRPDLAGPIDDWMDRALHPDPFWRFPTADAMKRSLAVAIRGTEIALEQTKRAA